jgi:hypothetical protein
MSIIRAFTTLGLSLYLCAEPRPNNLSLWNLFLPLLLQIEGSTQLSAKAGPRLFAFIQEVHDSTFREAIGRHNGLEINTEGDR